MKSIQRNAGPYFRSATFLFLCMLLLFLILLTGCSKEEKNEEDTAYHDVTLIINREEAWGGAFLDYSIYLDDEEISSVSNGSTKQYALSLAEGKHTIYLKWGIASSDKIDFTVSKESLRFFFSAKTKSTWGIDLWRND
ncbi:MULTISPECIES: hypothetical protein [unclassified Paenibacillus]